MTTRLDMVVASAGPRRTRGWALALALALAGALALWHARESLTVAVNARPLPVHETERELPRVPPRARAENAHPEAQALRAAAPSGVIQRTLDEDDPVGVPGSHPHPITSEHERIYRELSLVDQISKALQARAFGRARALIQQHHDEYPADYDDLEDGYSRLADCMEHPSAETRARAQSFFDEQTYSTSRRNIRRFCLEPTE